MSSRSARQLLALSEEFLIVAIRDQPEGMLEVVFDAHTLPQIMDSFARAMKIRYDKAVEYPIHPAIKEMYGAVHQAQLAVVKAAGDIGPQIERVHGPELARLRNARMRGNERMWDVRANQDGA